MEMCRYKKLNGEHYKIVFSHNFLSSDLMWMNFELKHVCTMIAGFKHTMRYICAIPYFSWKKRI